MKLEDYTADAICRAVSLPSFIEASWVEEPVSSLRVVFTPSFSPEVCVTARQGHDQNQISIKALSQHFWLEKSPHVISFDFEEVAGEPKLFDEISRLFDEARAAMEQRTGICIDGMGVEACLVAQGAVKRFSGNAIASQSLADFVVELINATWTRSQSISVRNALARCAFYVSEDYPVQPLPPQPPVTRLAILGTQDERTDYLEKLEAIRRARKRVTGD